MSLRVWLPLNGTLENKGLSNINLDFSPTYIIGGKIGNKCLASQLGWFEIPDMAGKKQMSFAYWVKINTATSSDWLDTFSWYSTDGTNNYRNRQEFYTNSTRTNIWYKSSSANATNSSFVNTIGEWNHYIFTIDYDRGEACFYINGEITGTKRTNIDTTSYIKGTGSAFLLRENGLDSHINDFRLYDHVLSPLEVKQISQGLILHYPLNNNGFGQENLYGNGGDCINLSGLNNYGNKFSVTIEDGQTCAHATGALNNTAYLQSKIPFTPKPNEEMTFSAWVKIKNIVRGTTNPMCGFYFSGQTINGSWRGATKLKLTVDGIEYSVAQDAWDKAVKDTKWHKVICSAKFGNYEYTNNVLPNIYLRDCTGDLYIHHIKYQRGTIATPWCPNKTDKMSDKIGLNDSIEYDCSGFNRNGEKININYNSDTPKYDVSSVFDAASPSIIKISNSNYAIQGIQNMTWSIWAYKDDWNQFSQRVYSCTEGGGLNIQPTSSGQIEWAINVYTNAEKTSHKYDTNLYIRIPKTEFSSGWHMFTWVYTTSGTSLYIDGILKQSKTGTSYGIYFHSIAPLILGGQATSTNYSSPYLDGKLSDFRIYVTALSAEDILALYKNSIYIDNEGNLYGVELREV